MPSIADIVGKARQSKVVRYGFLVFAAQMTVNVCNFAFHVIVSRRIGVAAYGSLNALVAMFNVCAVPAVILTTLIVKHVADVHARGHLSEIRAFAKRSAGLMLGLAASVVVVGCAASPAIAAYLRLNSVVPVILTVGILGFNLALPLRGVLQGVENFRSYGISLVSEAIVKVILAFAFGAGYGLNGALFGWLLGTVVSYGYTVLAIWWQYRGRTEQTIRLKQLGFNRDSWAVALGTLFVTSMAFSDLVIVKHAFSANVAGLYGAAALSGRMIYFLVSFVPIVVLPRVAHLTKEGQSTRGVLYQALGLVALLSGLALSVYFLRPGMIVTTLAGAAYAPAASLVFPYAVATALLGFVNVLVFYRLGTSSYAFLIPFSVAAVGEVAALTVYHGSPLRVIEVLIISNCIALAALGYSGKKRAERVDVEMQLSPPAANTPLAEEVLA